jgi:O-antigen/teichoic acid export membrane protein
VLSESTLRGFVLRILAASSGLLLPIVVVMLIGVQTILLIYGAAYAAQGPLLLGLLVVAAIPATIVAVGIGLMRAQNHNRQLVFSQGALCAAALGLAYVLLPRYGITGVGLAWLVAQTGAAVYLLLAEFRPLFRRSQQPNAVELR